MPGLGGWQWTDVAAGGVTIQEQCVQNKVKERYTDKDDQRKPCLCVSLTNLLLSAVIKILLILIAVIAACSIFYNSCDFPPYVFPVQLCSLH